MPEGPEVKTTVDFLKQFENKILTNFDVLSGRYIKKPIHNLDNPEWQPPLKIEKVGCKGKFIYFCLSNDVYFFNTLGMTGNWSDFPTKHSRVKFTFQNGEILYFNDIRNFGTLKIILDKKELDHKLNSLGPDILTTNIDWEQFKKQFSKKSNKTIAECLMNQSIISGVGNYLKAEILYCSEISPHRLIKDIKNSEWRKLHDNTLEQSRRSYKLGGATIATYRQPNGKEGLYNRRFAVYNQKTDPNGKTVIKEQTSDKRTTHWVPEIQK